MFNINFSKTVAASLIALFTFATVANAATFTTSETTTQNYSITLPAGTTVVLELAERVTPKSVARARAIAVGKIIKIKEASFNFPAIVTIEATNVQTADDRRIDIHGEASFKGAFKGESTTVKNGEIVEAITDTNVSIRGVRQ